MARSRKKKYPRISLRGLARARKIYERKVPRDLFYRAATELIALARRRKTTLTLSEALALLLRTWDASYFGSNGTFDQMQFGGLEKMLKLHGARLRACQSRTIESISTRDEEPVQVLFAGFESILGPVGAAKALHFLAPRFFPIWDPKIAKAYGVSLGKTGSNAGRYWQFVGMAREQAEALRSSGHESREILKELDEYNYCRFTNSWM